MRYYLSGTEVVMGVKIEKVPGVDLAHKRTSLLGMAADAVIELVRSSGFMGVASPGHLYLLPSNFLYLSVSTGSRFIRVSFSAPGIPALSMAHTNVDNVLKAFPVMRATSYSSWMATLALQVLD